MKTNDIITLVEDCIQKGLSNQNNIEPWVHQLKCWSTPEIKSLLNNLGKVAETYLEVGVFHGGTFFSTVTGNPNLKAYACDIFIEDTDSSPSTSFKAGIERLNRENVKFFNKDCFTIDKNDIPDLIDVYLYDGPHYEADQEKALTHYLPFMNDVFVLMIDDFNAESVVNGTRKALETLKDQITVEKEWVFNTSGNMQPIWWNGFYIAVISKKNKGE